MNETSKCKQLNCYLISGALVKTTAKQKNKPAIFFCQRNSDKDPTSRRGPEITDYSIKCVVVFKSQFLVSLVQGPQKVQGWQPRSPTQPEGHLVQTGSWLLALTCLLSIKGGCLILGEL